MADWISCPLCGLQTQFAPPHGSLPCPQKVVLDQVLKEKLEAETAYYESARNSVIRTAQSTEGMLGFMKDMTGGDDEG